MKCSGLRRICPLCNSIFYLCSDCDRWHVYCSSACSSKARSLSLKKAQATYLKTPNGRKANSRAQKKFRQKQKTVIDHSSTKTHDDLPLSSSQLVLIKEKACESNNQYEPAFLRSNQAPENQDICNHSEKSSTHKEKGRLSLLFRSLRKPLQTITAAITQKPLGFCRVCGAPIFRLRSHDFYPGEDDRR